eukprot:TRINITY_DN12740_c0_g2_i3.p1 TRINITY_DN12740_c0_g2~~TRINITY_DN12740_c0_g2_i3.p1  ORF type:complete len:280 (-),score=83.89 TRINITY_DN12740_c0_g2_i3:30-869(-)
MQFFNAERKTPANVRCGYVYAQNSARFVLDCGRLYDLSTAALYFKKDNLNTQLRLRVRIHGVANTSSGQKYLLREKEYPSHVWERLTSLAYSNDKSKLDEKHELDSLVLSFGVFACRYLIVDVVLEPTYGSLQDKGKADRSYLVDGIIAEAYGVPQEKEAIAIPELEQLLNVDEQQKQTRQVGHSAVYNLIQSSKSYVEVFESRNEQTAAKIDIKQSKEENVEKQLAELQSQLRAELKEYKEGKGAKQIVTDLVERLSLIHICRCRRLLTCRSRWSPYH